MICVADHRGLEGVVQKNIMLLKIWLPIFRLVVGVGEACGIGTGKLVETETS